MKTNNDKKSRHNKISNKLSLKITKKMSKKNKIIKMKGGARMFAKLSNVFTNPSTIIHNEDFKVDDNKELSIVSGMMKLGNKTKNMKYVDIVQEILKALDKSKNVLTSIDISNNNIPEQGIVLIIGALLFNNRNLTSLKITGNTIGVRGMKSISELLKVNTTLTSLNISNNNITNEGLEFLAEVLKMNTTLTSLNISYNKDIDNTFISIILSNNNTITKLDISGNPKLFIDDVNNFLELLINNKTLTELNMSDCRMFAQIGRSFMDFIGKLLKINNILKKLNISNNIANKKTIRIKEDDDQLYFGKMVISGLNGNKTLTALDISNDNLNTAFVFSLSTLDNETLTTLDISNNDIGGDTFLLRPGEIIGRMLTKNKTLTDLYINNNPFTKNNKEILYIIKGLKTNYTITDMHFTSNNELNMLLDRNKKLKEQKEKFMKIIKQIRENDPSMTSININNIEELKELLKVLKVNTTLTTLNINMDIIDDNTFKNLTEILKVNTSIISLILYIRNISFVKNKTLKDLKEILAGNTTLKSVISSNIKIEFNKSNKYKGLNRDTILAIDGKTKYTVHDLIDALSKKNQTQTEDTGPICMEIHKFFKQLKDIKLAIKIMQLSIIWRYNEEDTDNYTRNLFDLYMTELLEQSEYISRLRTDTNRRNYVLKKLWTSLESLKTSQQNWFGFTNLPTIYSLIILIINFMRELPIDIQVRWCDEFIMNYVGGYTNTQGNNVDVINSDMDLSGSISCPMGTIEKMIVAIKSSIVSNINIENNNDNELKLIEKLSREFMQKFWSQNNNTKLNYNNNNKTSKSKKYTDFLNDRSKLFKNYLKKTEEFKDLNDTTLDKLISKIEHFDEKPEQD